MTLHPPPALDSGEAWWVRFESAPGPFRKEAVCMGEAETNVLVGDIDTSGWKLKSYMVTLVSISACGSLHVS